MALTTDWLRISSVLYYDSKCEVMRMQACPASVRYHRFRLWVIIADRGLCETSRGDVIVSLSGISGHIGEAGPHSHGRTDVKVFGLFCGPFSDRQALLRDC
jgi:hypothetical protein